MQSAKCRVQNEGKGLAVGKGPVFRDLRSEDRRICEETKSLAAPEIPKRTIRTASFGISAAPAAPLKSRNTGGLSLPFCILHSAFIIILLLLATVAHASYPMRVKDARGKEVVIKARPADAPSIHVKTF